MTLVIAAVGGIVGLGLLTLTIWRPVLGCGAMVLTVPLTAGLARGAVIPLLKPSEAILLIVLAGVVVNRMAVRRSRPVTGLDLAVGGYVIGSVLIPWLVVMLTHYPADIDTWRTVVSPALFLAVYYVFSRTQLSDHALRGILNVAMLAGVIVSLVATAELVDVPGVRDLVGSYFPAPDLSSFRPGSTLGHYSAVGAFEVLTYILALALATAGHTGLSRRWLTLVMGISVVGVIVSDTWAPLATLPLATVIILSYGRRIPREFVVTLVAGALSLVVLWPLISARLDSQQVITAQGFAIPETMQTRILYWNTFIIPALSDHLWLGTGTVIPSTVPAPLITFVDNEYLWAAFRAGLIGVALLIGMLVAIMAAGWSLRSNPDPWRRAVGSAVLATGVVLMLLGATAQYITFAGLSQEIAMLVGVLAGLSAQVRVNRRAVIVVPSRPAQTWIPSRGPQTPLS